jgi:translation initiation factor IF-2
MKGAHIAGCQVIEGEIIRSERIRLIREENKVGESKIAAMQVERKDVKEAKKGQEVALVFRPEINFRLGDIVVFFKIV